jgi:acetyltransferase-like isoleucine patch superfamily enzyme
MARQLQRCVCPRVIEVVEQILGSARTARSLGRYYMLAVRRPALRGQRFTIGELSTLRVRPSGRWRNGLRLEIRSGFSAIIGGSVELGDDVFINERCSMFIEGVLKIGERVLIGPNVTFTDGEYEKQPLQFPRRTLPPRPIVLGDDVWIGAHAVILGGAVIEDGAVIGAGAVVTGLIPARSVAVGIPARPRV